MKKAIQVEEAAALIPDGASIMLGGFMAVGTPHRLIDALIARGAKDLTIICNDGGFPAKGAGKLVAAGCVKHYITSHIGLNPILQEQMISGKVSVELVPQGTLAERIRAAGTGLGGVLTKTGLGTPVQGDKPVIEIDGEHYLLEKPMFADFALLAAHQADYMGNLEYQLTAQNFNPVMAMAAKTVIAEPEFIVPVGCISPDAVRTPFPLVDYVVTGVA